MSTMEEIRQINAEADARMAKRPSRADDGSKWIDSPTTVAAMLRLLIQCPDDWVVDGGDIGISVHPRSDGE